MRETMCEMLEKIAGEELKVAPDIIKNIIGDAAKSFRNSDYIKISLADMMFWIQDRFPDRLFIKRGGNYGMKEVVPTKFAYPSFLALGDNIIYKFQVL